MKTPALLAALLIPALLAPLAHASGVTVTLEIGAGTVLAPGAVTCAVAVPAGANGGDVLDAAVANGCIGGWSSQVFDGFGRFVTCVTTVTEVCQQQDGLVTFWEFGVNGDTSNFGIDLYSATAGDRVQFVYTNFAAEPATLI